MLTSGQKIGDNEYVQVDRDYEQVLWGMSKWYDVCPSGMMYVQGVYVHGSMS